MLVTLKSNWFAPNGTLYQKGKNVEIPDELYYYLPKTATVTEGLNGPLPKVTETIYKQATSLYPDLPIGAKLVETLRDFDEVRLVTDSEGEVHKRTDAEQKAINDRMAKARAARKTNTVSDEDA